MRALLAFWLALAAWTLPVAAQSIDDGPVLSDASEAAQGLGPERILAFASDIVIAPNGDYDVTETIRIVATGEQIKRGIQRDFPTSYRNGLGQRTRVSFDVLAVSRDGRPEQYELLDASNGMRVRIGQADVMLPPGEHVYVIRYRTSRQLSYRDGFDEIYWNVTGNGWTFPIEMAEARITLPALARFGNRAVYTGPDGSTARDATVVAERPGFIHFRTTAPLGSYSGLTVAAAFPKNVVAPPGVGRQLRWWLADWGPLVIGLAALAGLFVYFFYAWLRAGKGPRRGTIVPIFSPPDGLSAAACRYIVRMGEDNRGFTAAIIDLAVRGHIGITKEDCGWLAKDRTTLDRRGGGTPLQAPEMAMRDALLPTVGSTIELKQDNHSTLQDARATLNKGLEEAYQGRLFNKNSGWAVAGLLAIPAAVLALTLLAIALNIGQTAGGIIKLPLIGAVALLVTWGLRQLTRNNGCFVTVLAWFGVVLAGMTAVFMTFASVVAAVAIGAWAVLLPLLALPLAISAFWWMYAPTVEGRAVMDRIEGFRRYLGITEEDRLETLHPPEKTPELFERYLPYAIALDVENRWSEKFSTVLAAAAVAGTTHAAAWYSGQGNLWDDPDGFASNVGSSLSSTISSASTSPSSNSGGSSSSGSSGGGSSGGGGGGGGGSGW